MAGITVSVRFYRLCEALQPYFTALYRFDIQGAEEALVTDYLHPEWAVMRFSNGTPPIATVGPGPLEPQWPFVVSGPTSQSIRFGLTRARIWGLGLQPAGWSRFVDAAASDYADRTVDGSADPAFKLFAPILDRVQDPSLDDDAVASEIDAFLLDCAPPPSRHEAAILACHAAIQDPEVGSVEQLGRRVGLTTRSLQRLCAAYFGFPPKLLLRRQRFLRSLAQFMLEPAMNWSSALDSQYYDQAQFVRDFRSFMGMTPGEYAAMPHPVLDIIMRQRMADQGAAPQTDLPTILRYTPS